MVETKTSKNCILAAAAQHEEEESLHKRTLIFIRSGVSNQLRDLQKPLPGTVWGGDAYYDWVGFLTGNPEFTTLEDP